MIPILLPAIFNLVKVNYRPPVHISGRLPFNSNGTSDFIVLVRNFDILGLEDKLERIWIALDHSDRHVDLLNRVSSLSKVSAIMQVSGADRPYRCILESRSSLRSASKGHRCSKIEHPRLPRLIRCQSGPGWQSRHRTYEGEEYRSCLSRTPSASQTWDCRGSCHGSKPVYQNNRLTHEPFSNAVYETYGCCGRSLCRSKSGVSFRTRLTLGSMSRAWYEFITMTIDRMLKPLTQFQPSTTTYGKEVPSVSGATQYPYR